MNANEKAFWLRAKKRQEKLSESQAKGSSKRSKMTDGIKRMNQLAKIFTPKSFREAIESQCMRSSASDSPFQSLETYNFSRVPVLAESERGCAPICVTRGAADIARESKRNGKPNRDARKAERDSRGAGKPVPEDNNDSSTLDYWKTKEGKCLACNCEISVEEQYCPTHAQELSEMLTDLE